METGDSEYCLSESEFRKHRQRAESSMILSAIE